MKWELLYTNHKSGSEALITTSVEVCNEVSVLLTMPVKAIMFNQNTEIIFGANNNILKIL